MKKLKYFGVLALLAVALQSCNKEDDNALNDAALLKTSAVIDRINEEDFQMGMETANDQSALESRTGDLAETSLTSCATVTKTSVGMSFPMTFEVDFGTGCTHNGITRSGMLTITFSDYLMSSGSVMTIERSNYVVNGYAVAGTVVYTNQTSGSTPQWTRTVVNGQITTPDGDIYTHTGTRTVRQTEGASTPFVLSDNTFEISSGTATVTRPNGSSLTATIVTPLVKHATCGYISEGVLNLQGTFLDGDLDYGNDTCDNTAIYTHSNGATYTVVLN